MKTAIITGGATGIGKAISIKLAQKGYNVIINYNKSEQDANNLKQELLKINKNIDIFQADLTKRENIKKLVEFTINKYKTLDILINNAGIDQIKLFNDITDNDFYNIIDTNVYSVFALTQETIKYMITNKNGVIINISSIWGQVGASCEVMYSASKSAIDGMTKSLAKELGPSNIRVNSIAPGIIDTKMNANLNDKEKQDIIDKIPLERIGNPEDIAKCVDWLVEDKYTTGQIISINGGWF